MVSRRLLRTVAFVVVYVLVCVPAATRVLQRPGSPAPLPIGFFSKSGELPPDTVVVLPDLRLVVFAMVRPAPTWVEIVPQVQERVPSTPQPRIQRSPRPPPASPSL